MQPEAKRPQPDVHYRPAHRERRCGACVHFQPAPDLPGSCERVEGAIHPAMCCDLWRPLKHGGRPGADPVTSR